MIPESKEGLFEGGKVNLTDKRYRVTAILMSIPGVAGIFLPFLWKISPFDAIKDEVLESLTLVLPAFMAIVILIWHVQRFAFKIINSLEQKTLALVALVASFSPISWIIFSLVNEPPGSILLVEKLMIFFCALGTIASFIFLVSYISEWGKSENRLELLLHSSPLPTYALWLTIMFVEEEFPEDWETGTYSILLAACCYIFMLIVGWMKRSDPASN